MGVALVALTSIALAMKINYYNILKINNGTKYILEGPQTICTSHGLKLLKLIIVENVDHKVLYCFFCKRFAYKHLL